MGIGNASYATEATDTITDLITPHGDRKPPRSRRSRSPPAKLITPHGDRKHRRPARWRRWPCTHYPSWGSETPGTLITVNPGDVSLPLMGIGNLAAAADVVEYLPLITPYGDRKLGSPVPSTSACVSTSLITPHGDRKPRPYRQHRRLQRILITPHGDRKRRIRMGRRVARRALITPHGDRKLEAGVDQRDRPDLLITPHGDRKPLSQPN